MRTYAAVPMRTSCILPLVRLDIKVANTSIETATVVDFQKRLIGIQSSKNTGMIKIPTGRLIIVTLITVEVVLLVTYFEPDSGTFSTSAGLCGRPKIQRRILEPTVS
jgi:hypothetical protein